MKANKTVIVIAGPTAVGKTGVALEVAKSLQTEIISADSRQCYRELKIGVARPTETELAVVPHHFIATHSIIENINAAYFEKYALAKTHGLFKKLDTVVMTGGTGLYLKAFSEGLDKIPDVPDAIHQQVVAAYKKEGLSWLQQEVQQVDPLFYSRGETQNPQRLMRALEVYRATGKSIEAFKHGVKATRDFNILKIGLHLSKDALHRNINTRVDKMIQQGLLEEVKTVLDFRTGNALQTVGYKELFDYLDGKWSLEAAIEAIKLHTRQYAKRQLTWFRKDTAYTWLSPDAVAVMDFLRSQGIGTGI